MKKLINQNKRLQIDALDIAKNNEGLDDPNPTQPQTAQMAEWYGASVS